MNLKVEPHDSALSNLFVKLGISLEFRIVKNLVFLRRVLGDLWVTEAG